MLRSLINQLIDLLVGWAVGWLVSLCYFFTCEHTAKKTGELNSCIFLIDVDDCIFYFEREKDVFRG